MSTSYSVHVELDRRQFPATVPEAMREHLDEYHAAIGTSPRGWLDAQITLPAETITQAASSAVSVVVAAAAAAGVHAQAVAVEVTTTAEFDIRQGFKEEVSTESPAAVIGTVEAAEILGVTRQRVTQLISEGKLDPVPVGRRGVAVLRPQVEQLRRARA